MGTIPQGLRPNGVISSFPHSPMGAGHSDTTNPFPAATVGEKKNREAQAPQPERASSTITQTLTKNDLKLIQKLKQADTEVRAHEMAHIAAGGQYITSGANLQYQRGPDGKNYAVAGEVSIDTSPIPGDPRATARKMQKIKAAALAPSSPSAQDRKVAATATALAAKATAEIMALVTAQRNDSANNGPAASPAVSNVTAATAYVGMAEQTTPRGTYINATA